MKHPADLRIPFVWKDRHTVLLDRFLYIPGYYQQHNEWKILPWKDPAMFGNDHPVVIEYCSGNGQWICDRAKNNPHLNWVAVEKRFDRSRKIWVRLHREKLANLIIVCGEAIAYTKHYVPPCSVSEIYVNFPDPWPKLRHAKHRLICTEFLEQIEKIITPKGKAIFTTDDRSYVDQMLEVVSGQVYWKPLSPSPYFTTEWPDFGSSYFCDLWKGKGRCIHHLPFEVNL